MVCGAGVIGDGSGARGGIRAGPRCVVRWGTDAVEGALDATVAEVAEDAIHDNGIRDDREHAQLATAFWASERVNFQDLAQQACARRRGGRW